VVACGWVSGVLWRGLAGARGQWSKGSGEQMVVRGPAMPDSARPHARTRIARNWRKSAQREFLKKAGNAQKPELPKGPAKRKESQEKPTKLRTKPVEQKHCTNRRRGNVRACPFKMVSTRGTIRKQHARQTTPGCVEQMQCGLMRSFTCTW